MHFCLFCVYGSRTAVTKADGRENCRKRRRNCGVATTAGRFRGQPWECATAAAALSANDVAAWKQRVCTAATATATTAANDGWWWYGCTTATATATTATNDGWWYGHATATSSAAAYDGWGTAAAPAANDGWWYGSTAAAARRFFF